MEFVSFFVFSWGVHRFSVAVIEYPTPQKKQTKKKPGKKGWGMVDCMVMEAGVWGWPECQEAEWSHFIYAPEEEENRM